MNTLRPIPEYLPRSAGDSAVATAPLCTIRLTVDRNAVTQLRRLAAEICGQALEFIRISSVQRASKMKVCLCVSMACAELLLAAIAQRLPEVQFGTWPLPARGHA